MTLVVDVTPDLAGFRDAQRRLRGYFGEDIVFYQPAVNAYPPGTPIDPETGRPYDPMIDPTSSDVPQATVTCTVAYKAGTGEPVDFNAMGVAEQTHIMLIADIADRASCEPAIEFDARGERFAIVAQKPDGIGEVQRWLVWGRRK